MKYLVLVCAGMVDDPIEALGGRTPLEIAKLPGLEQLAKKGKVGSALFVPRTLKATPEAACFSILGYDPAEFYTGVAPLDAIAMGIPQSDRDIAFRCDFVTVLDDTLVDAHAGAISARESDILLQEINHRIADPRFVFHSGHGYKNILLIRDPELNQDLDETECFPPADCVGRKVSKFLPKGKASSVLTEIVKRAKEVLENHEINRVRIDLKENPANGLWLWGQGESPKVPNLCQNYKIPEGGVWATEDFVRGLGKAAGLEAFRELEPCVRAKDFIFLYFNPSGQAEDKMDYKSRIRYLEDFDLQIVKYAVKLAENLGDVRVLVTSDVTRSSAKKTALHEPVPFLISGSGISRGEGQAFHEKAAAQSQLEFAEGHKLLEFFLKS